MEDSSFDAKADAFSVGVTLCSVLCREAPSGACSSRLELSEEQCSCFPRCWKDEVSRRESCVTYYKIAAREMCIQGGMWLLDWMNTHKEECTLLREDHPCRNLIKGLTER